MGVDIRPGSGEHGVVVVVVVVVQRNSAGGRWLLLVDHRDSVHG